eukprot:8210320-Alexandrium_andersonii.AAC.1
MVLLSAAFHRGGLKRRLPWAQRLQGFLCARLAGRAASSRPPLSEPHNGPPRDKQSVTRQAVFGA